MKPTFIKFYAFFCHEKNIRGTPKDALYPSILINRDIYFCEKKNFNKIFQLKF